MRAISKTFKLEDGSSIAFNGNTFPYRKAMSYMSRALQIQSSILPNFKYDREKELTKQDFNLSELVTNIAENIGQDGELLSLVNEMLGYGKLGQFELIDESELDNAFSGRLDLMLQVLTFILVENYGSLFKKKLISNLSTLLGISMKMGEKKQSKGK
jgi:hypothetical protein